MNNKRVPTIDGLAIDKAHKGGKIKSFVKSVSKAAKQTSSAVSGAGKTLSKVGAAAAGAVQDPGTWAAYLINPALGGAVGGQGAVDNYNALNQAEKDAARAEAEKRMALDKERKATLEQEKMVSDKAKAAAASAKERATRMGQGRRGLLFQGKESGVTGLSKTLGG